MQTKLTEGNITKSLIKFAIPILIGSCLQRIYTLADTIIVGRLLGTDQLAAVGAASVIANLFIDLCVSFTTGFSIVVAQYYGANDEKNRRQSLAATYFLAAFLVILLTTVGLLLIKPLLHLTRTPAEIFDFSTQYLHILIGGLICSLIYNLLANLLRSLGDSIIPLVFLVISVSLNVVLDYSLIKYAALGVRGAAIATVISQGFAGISCLIFCFFKRQIVHVNRKDFVFNSSIYKKVISQGLATALMFSVVTLSTLILQTGINSLGTDMIAGYLAGRKYLELFMIPGAALAMTAGSFVSQNYGANNYHRIKEGVKQLILIGFTWAAISFVILFLFAKPIVISVTGKNAAIHIIESGIQYLKIGVCFFPFLFVLVITRSSLQGMNHRKTPVFSSCIELIVKSLAVFVLVPFFDFLGICITEPLVWLINALWLFPMYLKYLKRDWK
ncbi:MAG: MATE family efflux transporter [Treponema sp.]|nr:MATE family efflux transporter [Treponema sp.]